MSNLLNNWKEQSMKVLSLAEDLRYTVKFLEEGDLSHSKALEVDYIILKIYNELERINTDI